MRIASAILLVALFSILLTVAVAAPRAGNLPSQLSDAEFFRTFTEFSKPGGVYIGVGPEQNFTYVAGVKPKMALVFDIRRQNAIEPLMYKAIFEMSSTRGDFVSNLFSIQTPNKWPATATAGGVFLSILSSRTDRAFRASFRTYLC